MKKLLIGAVALNLLGFSLVAHAVSFTDTTNNWAQRSIEQLSDAQLLGGYPDGSFKPQGSITRAEFASVLAKALGFRMMPSKGSSFSDVPNSHWAAPAIEAVKENAIIKGYPNGTFAPASPITRAEAMVTLAAAAGLQLPESEAVDKILAFYADADQVPMWAKPSVAAMVASGLFQPQPNLGNQLQPLAKATRADIAYLTNSYLKAEVAQNPYIAKNQNKATQLKGYVVTLPASSAFTGVVQEGLSSETATVGSELRVALPAGLSKTTDTTTLVPAGSQLKGRVVAVTPSGLAGKNASLKVVFDTLVLPDNREMPLTASIATEQGLLEGGSTAGRLGKAALKTAIGAGAGAALGTALAPLSGGKVGKGAIYGTAIGAGAGALAAVAGKGKPVVLMAGETLELKLDAPLTLEADSSMTP